MIAGLLHETVTIARRVAAADGQGGYTWSTVVLGTTRGRIRAAETSEIIEGGQRGAEITHVVHLAAGSDVRRGDILTVGGETYEVETVTAVRGLIPETHHLRLAVRAVQRGGG